MIFDVYPYTNFHEMNDDWIIQIIKELDQKLDDFVAVNSLTYADPLDYNVGVVYERNTVVVYDNAAYVTKRTVPAGVLPSNDEYWLMIFPFGDLIQTGIDAGVAEMSQRVNEALAVANTQFAAAIVEIPTIVKNWLNEHPDVTTTVQDGAISFPKLSEAQRNVYLAQFNESDIYSIIDFVQGSLDVLTGREETANNACRTKYLMFGNGIVKIRTQYGYVVAIYKYALDATFEAVEITEVDQQWNTFAIDTQHMYRLTIMKEDHSTLTPNQLPATPVSYCIGTQSGTAATRNMNTKGVGRFRSQNVAPVYIANNNNIAGMGDMIPCIGDTEYTATFYNMGTGTIRASYFAADKSYLSEVHYNGISSLTFTTPANAAFVHVWMYSAGGIIISDGAGIQVEWGSSSTQYIEPYTYVDQVARDALLYVEDNVLPVIDRNVKAITQLQYADIGRYVSHLGAAYNTFDTIPSQSVFDIERAKRLGFKAIELNVLTTSDGEFITTHGVGGAFGNAFTSLDNTNLTNVLVSSVTLSYIKTNVRYKSTLDKYKVAPPTLEEALLACHKFGIVPAIQYVAGVIEIADEILGKGNYILSLMTNDRPSGVFDGPCMSWLTLNTEADVLAKCNASGGAYMAGFNSTNAAYSSFTDGDWKSMFGMLHSNGYRAMTAYLTDPMKNHKMITAGLDYICSTYQIPDIISGNICNLTNNESWSDFTTTGSVSNNAVSLSSGQTIRPHDTYSSVFLGGGAMHIRFNGSITVTMGHFINTAYTLTSDGTEDIFISTYFDREAPTFTIAATAATTVYELTYKASNL